MWLDCMVRVINDDDGHFSLEHMKCEFDTVNRKHVFTKTRNCANITNVKISGFSIRIRVKLLAIVRVSV